MRAILHDPSAPHGLRLGEAPDPQPGEHEALSEVQAIALNFADVAFLAERRKPGEVVGFEAAGATMRLHTCDRVRVNGGRGTVEILRTAEGSGWGCKVDNSKALPPFR